ncbi:DMT family transporter [Geobacter pickeringii]|uniref:Membrane protein n=1 Tax=Geobacter pickeringii TaxID=345632 RepID=A0A0B5BKQ7_9BACT|nr:DMT family transporter [Geobacter pickeringii]AJE04651.1 membrane protein [Geobacter pickeringii]
MKKFSAIAALILTTFFWGITFTIVKDAVARVDVFVFLAQRFVAAFVLLAGVSLARRTPLDLGTVRSGVILGAFLFASYAFQTMALRFTTASNTGFLTGLSVVLVPLLGSLFFRHAIPATVKTGVALSLPGLFLLCTNGALVFNLGDLLAALCAVCISLHLILTGSFARDHDVCWLTTIQLGTVALLSLGSATASGHPVLVWHPGILGALIICALFATVFAFLVQTTMQRVLTPSHTALIFCLEPVFAAAYAWWAAGERLGTLGLLGALLILGGMVVSELPALSSRLSPTVKGTADA